MASPAAVKQSDRFSVTYGSSMGWKPTLPGRDSPPVWWCANFAGQIAPGVHSKHPAGYDPAPLK